MVNRCVITIQLLDFLSTIQVTIQLTDHSAIKLLWAIWLLDVSDNQMPTVVQPYCAKSCIYSGSEKHTSPVFRSWTRI